MKPLLHILVGCGALAALAGLVLGLGWLVPVAVWQALLLGVAAAAFALVGWLVGWLIVEGLRR